MATFNITVGSSNFYVEKQEVVSTECASIYTYTINATNLDVIDISLVGNHDNEIYISNSVTNSFTDSVTGIVYNTSLTVQFILENSGNPGSFYSSTLVIDNVTTGGQYTDSVTRQNDTAKCVNVAAADYDTLSDTPNSKVGNALKFVRVNAAETEHEYVTALGDGNFVYDQALPEAIWTITHTLNKRCSATIVDTSGTVVIGDIQYINDTNIIITFSSAFAGKAYLN